MKRAEPQQTADRLLADYLAGHLSERDKTRLLAWLRADPEHMTEFVRQIDLHAGLAEEFRGGQAIRDILASVRMRKRKPARLLRLFPLAAAAAALIALGVGLWLNRAPAAQPLAHVQDVQGHALGFRDSAAEARPLRIGDEIWPGMRIETGEASEIALAWLDRTAQIALAESSVFSVSARDSTMLRENRHFLRQGKLTATVARQRPGQTFAVKTRHAIAEVTGTRFELDARPELTQLAIRDGSVDFTHRARNVTIPVPALHWAMAAPGADPQIAPLGADMQAKYSWDFREPPDPEFFKVFEGQWRHNPEEECMETMEGMFRALINLPVHGLPLVVEYEISPFVDPAKMDKKGFVHTGRGLVDFDRIDKAEGLWNLFARPIPTESMPRRAAQWGAGEITRYYVFESGLIGTDKQDNLEDVIFLEPAPENNRLVLHLQSNRTRLNRFSIRSIRSGDVPDVSVFRQAINALPDKKRKGIWDGPDPRPDRQDQEVRWGFQTRPTKLSPFDYAPWQPPDMPANYSWHFREPPDPDVLKVARGSWRHVPEEQCMEADGLLDLLINIPVHGLPLLLEYDVQSYAKQEMFSHGAVYYDHASQAAIASRFDRPDIRMPRHAEWGPTPPITMRYYITESSIVSIADYRSEPYLLAIRYYHEGHDGARLVLGGDDRMRIHSMNLRSVPPESLPDTSVFLKDLESIPETERKGTMERPDPRQGQEGCTFQWLFHRQYQKITPFEY